MIIGINYKDDGSRIIGFLYYNSSSTSGGIRAIADSVRNQCDEVYVVGAFDPNDQSFIDTVVTQGCRL